MEREKVLLNVPYKSQLDNVVDPFSACNVTAIAMGLEYLGVKAKSAKVQLEDELSAHCKEKGLDRQKPYDLAKVVTNYGRKDIFSEYATENQIRDWLGAGLPAVTHGWFTNAGHIITIIGYDEEGFIVHDPYGEYFVDGYRTDLSGASLHYSYELIHRTCVGSDKSFWVHFLSR
ncbi:C39 family peptidase [Microcoleus sp. FACHB-68]|uniref:C39 family peptidase n=1 Tax=Microcoleus sp. FACHB-68 TaxID=2692826 RepID=UPI0016886F04|nr:C39 family peptidase [Microcoleus sp. FACHB-68]MBD1939088.1 C39 family peptidase [Microcoleus sp. FACHB-68]